MLKIAICEDLSLHQKRLSEKVHHCLNEPHTIDTFSSIAEFKSFCAGSDQPFDIIFMDIELSDGSGIQLSQKINQLYPLSQIVYITAYPEYSSEVYESEHVWFIDKQKLDTFLPLALNKALRSIRLTQSLHLNFSWKKVDYSVLQGEIIYIERSLRVSEIHTTKQIYKTSEKLELLLKQLTDSFILCHRSYIINMANITGFEGSNVILNEQYSIPVSRSKHDYLKQAYNMFLIKV